MEKVMVPHVVVAIISSSFVPEHPGFALATFGQVAFVLSIHWLSESVH